MKLDNGVLIIVNNSFSFSSKWLKYVRGLEFISQLLIIITTNIFR